MKKTAPIIIIGFIIAIFSGLIAIAAIDAPHNASNNISCGSCHGAALLNSPFWCGSYSPYDIDDTVYNKLCLNCHRTLSGPYTDTNAPLVKTHSSLTTDNGYGDWTRECRTCHDPHYQKQKNYKNTDAGNLYLATGTITSCVYNGNGTSTLTYSTITSKSGWDAVKLTQKTGNYRRTILFPNVGKLGYNYPVTAVDTIAKTITVTGNATAYLYPPTTFAALYGQYIKDIMDISADGSGVNKTVKFFDQAGTKSFADGDTIYNGVCEVCHTQTTHFRNNGSGSDQNHTNVGSGIPGTNCISCHPHVDGFKPSCNACHGYPPPPLASIPLPTGSTTAGAHVLHVPTKGYQCSICHYNSAGEGVTHNNHIITLGFVSLLGAYTGGSYDGHTTANYQSSDAGTTVSKTGNKRCSNIYCHGGTMAPNGGTAGAVWDNPSSAACGTCHGASASNPPVRGSHPEHAGSAGRQLECTLCHYNYASAHINGSVNWAYDPATYVWLSGALYRGNASGSQTPVPSVTYGQCSNLYCHSNVQGVNGNGAPTFYATPAWGGTVNCGDCHASTMTTGSHTKHTSAPYLYACTMCHTSETAITHSDHYINFVITYSQGASSTPGNGYGTCSNISCHSNGTNIWTGGTPSGTTPQWGSGSLSCNGCHGNTTYSDYRKGTPLYASGSPKPNAHPLHTDARTTPSGEPQCNNCHRSVTATNTAIDGTTPANHANGAYSIVAGNTYKDGDNVGGVAVSVTTTYNYSGTPNTSTCSNVSCHPTGLAGSKAASITKWSNAYSCTDCHKIDMNNTSGYHHVMDATALTDRTYPTPHGTGAIRKCTMCHVDHDIFSPMLNSNSTGRSYNLRTTIGTTPTKTSAFTNSDYLTGGGICISCHGNSTCLACHTGGMPKNTTAQKNDGTTVAMTVTDAQFSTSAHQYNVATTMLNGGATFNANCSKCHNAKNGETTTFQSSTNKFGTHDDTLRRLFASLGMTSPTDPEEEDFCYRCHSKTTDSNPGGGPAKATAAKDYYGVGNMSNAGSEDIFTIFGKTYKHNVAGYSGLHKPSSTDETRTYLSANKHVECNDCHNPHAAKAGLHSSNQVHVAAKTNLVSDSGPLTGAQGAEPTWSSSNWGGASAWPTTTSTATKEYQICFKCHTNYNTNYASWGGAGTASWTNVSLEFNPKNQSYHPVVQGIPEIDPGYEYDPLYGDEYDSFGSNRLPPAFISLVIGDSGKTTSALEGQLTDSTKNWAVNQWQNWGLRIGTISTLDSSNKAYNGIKRITGNTSTQLSFDQIIFPAPQSTNTTYSIEYYAGRSTKSGTTVTDTYKNFNLYLPSLVGYVVVVADDCGLFSCGSNVAKGTVISNTATSFTVDSWTVLNGAVPADATVGYYFSATGHAMMCSDCHSNDTISSTTAMGPHGSAVKWMLKGRNRAWPTLSASENGTGTGTLRKIGRLNTPANHRSVNDGTANGLFCLNCHSTVSFSKNAAGLQNGQNVHIIHGWFDGPACINCHVLVPHGSSESRLIGNTSMPARYSFNNDTANMYMIYFRKIFDSSHTGRAGDPADYSPQGTKQNCFTVGATVGCHHGG